MYLHDHSQKIIHFRNVLCLNFIDPLRNHSLFHLVPAKIMHILEITCKKIVYWISIMGEKRNKIKFYTVGCEIDMNMSISNEMIMHFGNWSRKCIFYQFSMLAFFIFTFQYILLRMCWVVLYVHMPCTESWVAISSLCIKFSFFAELAIFRPV